MAGINTRVVRRTNAVLGFPWTRDFRYDEVVSAGPGVAGLVRALGHAGTLSGIVLGALPGGRAVLERVLPAPGEGPSAEEREAGHFEVLLIGKDEAGQTRLRGRVNGYRDPGYGETAKMLGESAVCLARDPSPVGGGSWTPASAMGDALLGRLKTAGMGFEVEA